jgi:hypothetical protein
MSIFRCVQKKFHTKIRIIYYRTKYAKLQCYSLHHMDMKVCISPSKRIQTDSSGQQGYGMTFDLKEVTENCRKSLVQRRP